MNEDRRFGSWKEIGAYLERDARTVRRWEKEEGLPIHRHTHKKGSSVYAYLSELDAWRASRRAVPEPAPPLSLWKTLLAAPRSLALGLTVVLCLITVGNTARPVSAQQPPTEARQLWANARGGGEDSISPDGRYMVYADWESGNLAVRDLRLGTSRQLTNTGGWVPPATGWAEDSAISPDGSQVVYHWWDSTKNRNEIRILPLQGAEIATPRTVCQGQGCGSVFGWSPDAKRLYTERRLADGTTQLAVLSIGDGSVRVLKSMGWLAVQARVSPDGRYIAYDPPTGDGAPSSDIAILATDGSTDNVIVHHPARDFSPMWAPDGRSLIFLSDRTGRTSLWKVPVENGKAAGKPVLVKADAGQILPKAITNTGALYYEIGIGGARNVYVAELDADLNVTKEPVLLTERFLNSNFHPSWSPDGKSIAYYSWREGYYQRPFGPLAPEVATVLVIHSVKTGQERDIRLPLQVRAYKANPEPKWFPDGHAVLVTGWVSERPGLAYFRVDLDTGKTSLLHRPHGNNVVHMDLSPDGKFIYYIQQAIEVPSVSYDGRLERFDLASRQVVEVRRIPLAGDRTQFKLSPDGKQIAFAYPSGLAIGDSYDSAVGKAKNSDALYIAPVDGGKPRFIGRIRDTSNNGSGNTLAWSPDQKYLLFAQSDESGKAAGTVTGATQDESVYQTGSSVWKIPVSGGEVQKIGISVQGEVKTPRLSPDGRQMVYEAMTLTTREEVWSLENFLLSKVTSAR
jgi:Tol biopolymer transport system component